MLERIANTDLGDAQFDLTHLAYGLDEPLPEALFTGKGAMLNLRGWCYSVEAPLQSLEIVVGDTVTAVPNHSWGRTDIFMDHCPRLDSSGNSLLSGFTAFVPLFPVGKETDIALILRATLQNAIVIERSLGSVLLRPGYGADPVAVEWPGSGPRVAICMTTFRPPPALFLAQVASIQAQTHKNWVCIISDDNTENEHYDRLRLQLRDDKRVKFVQNRVRLNFYDNFQQVLCRAPADADFVALCDQDDIWQPTKIERLIQTFSGDVQLSYSDARLADAAGNIHSNTFWKGRRNNHTDLPTLMVANTITGAASIFRASLLPDILPFPKQVGPLFHDHWIGLVALVRGGIAYVDAPLYDYVQHDGGVIGHNYHRWPGMLAAFLSVVRAGPSRSDIAQTASLVLKQALSDYEFVLQKIALSRLLLLRFPDVEPNHRYSLERFSRFETSLRAALNEKIAANRARRPTLNLEGLLLWCMVGVRLRNYGLKVKQPALTQRQTNSPGGRLLGSVVSIAEQAQAAPQAPRVLTEAEKPHRWYPHNIPALEFGTTKWINYNIQPLQLDVSAQHPKRVNLLLATINFSYIFGGYIGMFNLALRLADEGYRSRIILHENTEWDIEEWRRKIQKYPGLEHLFDRVEVISRWDRKIPLEINPDDRFVATNCWAAHIAHSTVKSLEEKRFLFMAQEYEPFFMAMNSISALFQQSYEFPQFTLFSTQLLQDYFRREKIGVFSRPGGERDAAVFSNAIQKFYPTRSDMERKQRRLLFYARSEEHAARNLFELAIMALSKLVQDPRVDLTNWSFHGIGSLGGNMLDLADGLPLELVPKTSLEDYIKLMPSFDVGLSLMLTPHPSLVPLEMAAAGMVTVTNSYANKTARHLSAISTNLIGVKPTVEAIVDGLIEAMSRVENIEERLAGAHLQWPTEWADAFPPESVKRIREFLGTP